MKVEIPSYKILLMDADEHRLLDRNVVHSTIPKNLTLCITKITPSEAYYILELIESKQ